MKLNIIVGKLNFIIVKLNITGVYSISVQNGKWQQTVVSKLL